MSSTENNTEVDEYAPNSPIAGEPEIEKEADPDTKDLKAQKRPAEDKPVETKKAKKEENGGGDDDDEILEEEEEVEPEEDYELPYGEDEDIEGEDEEEEDDEADGDVDGDDDEDDA